MPKTLVKFRGHRLTPCLVARLTAAEPKIKTMNDRDRFNAEDIAARLAVTSETVHRYCNLLGIVLHHRKPHPRHNYDRAFLADRILPLHRAGLTDYDVAKAIGVSRPTVYRFLSNNGHRIPNERCTR